MGNSFKRFLAPAMGIAVAISFASISKADVFDTTLTPPGAGIFGWFNGAGVSLSQGGWTVDTANGIELGLRAKIRQGDVIDSPNSQYTVPAGLQDPSHAVWNYEFSIDVDPGGTLNPGGPTLAGITALITITDTATGNFVNYNPLVFTADDCAFGSGATAGNCTGTGTHIGIQAGDYVAQNSENPLFTNLFPAGYDPSASDTYDITLDVFSNTPGVAPVRLASDSIEVNVTPEPTAVILLGTIALALIVVKRRRTASVPTV